MCSLNSNTISELGIHASLHQGVTSDVLLLGREKCLIKSWKSLMNLLYLTLGIQNLFKTWLWMIMHTFDSVFRRSVAYSVGPSFLPGTPAAAERVGRVDAAKKSNEMLKLDLVTGHTQPYF